MRGVLPILRAVAARSASSQASTVSIAIDDKSGIGTITLQRPPVNSMNMELCQAAKTAFDDLAKSKSRGIILTSAQPTVFCAGLDLTEMYQPDDSRLRQFWGSLQDLWLTVYSSKIPTVAAINGHSPAGGCLLACSCEYRVMVDQPEKKFTIGLNETRLGIIAPPWFMMTFLGVVSRRVGERALIAGTLFPVQEALSVGLVDDVAKDKEEAIAKAVAWLQQAAKIPAMARSLTKLALRKEAIQWLKANKESDTDSFVTAVKSEPVQKGLGAYIESLKKK